MSQTIRSPPWEAPLRASLNPSAEEAPTEASKTRIPGQARVEEPVPEDTPRSSSIVPRAAPGPARGAQPRPPDPATGAAKRRPSPAGAGTQRQHLRQPHGGSPGGPPGRREWPRTAPPAQRLPRPGRSRHPPTPQPRGEEIPIPGAPQGLTRCVSRGAPSPRCRPPLASLGFNGPNRLPAFTSASPSTTSGHGARPLAVTPARRPAASEGELESRDRGLPVAMLGRGGAAACAAVSQGGLPTAPAAGPSLPNGR